MSTFLNYLLKAALGLVGEFVVAFVANLREARADNEKLATIVEQAVRTVARTDITSAEKRREVYERARKWIEEEGGDVKDSLLNTLIELAVQKEKAR